MKTIVHYGGKTLKKINYELHQNIKK